MRVSRQGFTLVELLVSLVLVALLGALVTRLLLQQQRSASRLSAIDGQREVVAQAVTWVGAELLETGLIQPAGDLLAASPDSLVYRGWRAAGLACLVAPTEIRIRRDLLSSWRAPQPGRDSLALYLTADSSSPAGWRILPVLAVSPATCGARPAIRVETLITRPLPATLPALTPVRTFEVMVLRFYRSRGEWWLGARSLSGGEGLQPVTGPFDAGGVGLRYSTAGGRPTARPDSIRRVELLLTPAGGALTRQLFAPRNFP